MKAFQTRSLTSLETLALGDLARPESGPGEVVIALGAACLQLGDLAMAMGQRLPRPELPFTPGMQGAGVVASVGEGVTALKAGDLVTAFLPSGGLAEYARTREGLAVPVPQGVSTSIAAALPHAHAATLVALRDRAKLARGEVVLVLGAGGEAGLAAVEIAKVLGARVIASANGAERHEAAREQGADDVIDAGNVAVADELRKLLGGSGANVVFDPVSGEAAIAAFPACAMGARYVMAGFAGGQAPSLDPRELFARDVTLIPANSHRIAERDPEGARAALVDVLAWAAEGRIKPRVAAKFALKEARHAFDYVRGRRGMGSVIVTME